MTRRRGSAWLLLTASLVARTLTAQTVTQTLQFDFLGDVLPAVQADFLSLKLDAAEAVRIAPTCVQASAVLVTCAWPIAPALTPGTHTLVVTRTSVVNGLTASGTLVYSPAAPAGPTNIKIVINITVP